MTLIAPDELRDETLLRLRDWGGAIVSSNSPLSTDEGDAVGRAGRGWCSSGDEV